MAFVFSCIISQNTQTSKLEVSVFPCLISYQFGITPVVQYKVLWFKVSVDNAFGMQVSKSLNYTGCVKPGGRVLK